MVFFVSLLLDFDFLIKIVFTFYSLEGNKHTCELEVNKIRCSSFANFGIGNVILSQHRKMNE
jgi:hypothetical protein